MVFDWLKLLYSPLSGTPKKSASLQSPVASDGRRRVFGDVVFAKHGDFLQAMGFGFNDPGNIIPNAEDRDRMVRLSHLAQHLRRVALEADLLARHGCNAIRPFFLLAEPVYNSDLGNWAIFQLKLLPYDEWNVIYLPTDPATAKALNLPLHPQRSFAPVDKLVFEYVSTSHKAFVTMFANAKKEFERTSDISAIEHIAEVADQTRTAILGKTREWMPMAVEMIANAR